MKRFLTLLLTLALLASLAAPALAFEKAQRSSQALSVDGVLVDCDKYNIDGSNYFKLRDLAKLLDGTGSQFDVAYDSAKRVISVTTGHTYVQPDGSELAVGEDKSGTTRESSQTIMIDGALRSDLTAYNIGGNNYFQLRQLGEALGFDVGYDTATRTMLVTSRSAVTVEDLCAAAGQYTDRSGYVMRYSYTLPKLAGADTACVREINAEMQEIYDGYVKASLQDMADGLTPMHWCVSYEYAERGGVHTLLVTSDSDFGMDEYWCFSFDGAGNALDNEALLAAAGLTPDDFMSLTYAFLKERTDYSGYMDDEAWQQLQRDTLAPENLNAEVPMALLPDGSLCFICTVYTIAGAGAYDEAFAITPDRTVTYAEVGQIFLDRLRGTYLDDESSEDEAALYELLMVGDTLMLEQTSFHPEYGSVYSYCAAELFPEDPAALYRADISAARFRAVPYSPDAFGGSYDRDARECTLTLTADGFTLSGWRSDGSDLTATSCYRGDLGLDADVPETDTEHFRYEDVSASGLPGIWSGAYRDENYVTHSLTLELTSWGTMRLRDCAYNDIPCVLEGSYYIAGPDDDLAPAGSLVFHLVRRGGYRMPVDGFTWMTVDAGDTLLITEEDEFYCHLTQVGTYEGAVVLTRAPENRMLVTPEITPLKEGRRILVDTAADGEPEEIRYVFLRDTEYTDAITGITVAVDGEGYTIESLFAYDADVYLVTPAMSGTAWLYIDGQSDNDYHFITVIGIRSGSIWWAGEFFGGFAGDPTDPEAMQIWSRFALLSTANAVRTYRVGLGGMPEAVDSFYRIRSNISLTSKLDIDCWSIDPATGALIAPEVLPAGTAVKLIRTDGSSAVDLQLADGSVCRVWVSGSWDAAINGVDIFDCFEGIVFGG